MEPLLSDKAAAERLVVVRAALATCVCGGFIL